MRSYSIETASVLWRFLDRSITHSLSHPPSFFPLSDYPSEFSSVPPDSVVAIKAATPHLLIQRVLLQDHGDLESLSAFCLCSHKMLKAVELFNTLWSWYDSPPKLATAKSICRFLIVWMKEKHTGGRGVDGE